MRAEILIAIATTVCVAMAVLLAIACLILSSGKGLAAEGEALVPAEKAVQIDADQVSKRFVFIIDHQPVAMLDKQGLHVVEGITYGGTLTDTGTEFVRETIINRAEEAADD